MKISLCLSSRLTCIVSEERGCTKQHVHHKDKTLAQRHFTFILAQLHMSIKREKHQLEDGLFVDIVLIYLSPVIMLNTEYSDSRTICLAYP